MAMMFNPISGKFDYYKTFFKGTLAAAPASPEDGWLYINSGNDTYYIYYGGSWQALHVLVPAAASYLLMETGDFLLLESGDKLVLET